MSNANYHRHTANTVYKQNATFWETVHTLILYTFDLVVNIQETVITIL